MESENAVGERREPAHQETPGSKAVHGNYGLETGNEVGKGGVETVGVEGVVGEVLAHVGGQDYRRFRARNRRNRVGTETDLMPRGKVNAKAMVQQGAVG